MSNLNSLWHNFALRKDPTAWEDNPDVNFSAWQCVQNSVAIGAPLPSSGPDLTPGDPTVGRRVEGRYYHTVQVQGTTTDTVTVEGSLDGKTWVAIPVTPIGGGLNVSPIVGDGIYTFVGLFKYIRFVVGSAGTAMNAYFLSAAP